MKLSDSQKAALGRLAVGECDYYDIARSGANGKTIDWLVTRGLAALDGTGPSKKWSITDDGRKALEEGRF